MFLADLHCHSFFSDGTDSPFALLEIAHQNGLGALSITDHDTVDAYSDELFLKAKELGIELLTGVEISSELDGQSVHILGYGFDVKDEKLLSFLKKIKERRAVRNRAILDKLKEYGMPIEEEELQELTQNKTAGRPHIASLMIQRGYVESMQEAFDKYLKEGASCYVFGIRQHPKEVIELLHKSSAKAVLAHPHFFRKKGFLRRLLSLGFDGIECYYGKLEKVFEAPILEIAKRHNLLITGGSDYHGSIKPHLFLGCSWTPEESFLKLKGRNNP